LFTQQAEQKMLGADMAVSEAFCLLRGPLQDSFAFAAEGQID
jgi:hypothetical protein